MTSKNPEPETARGGDDEGIMTERGGQTDAADDLLDHKKIKLSKDTGTPKT